MLLVAWQTVRGRLTLFTGTFVGACLGVVLVTMWGVVFASSVRISPAPDRLAATAVVIDGDPWLRDRRPDGREDQQVLSERRVLPAGTLERARRVPGVRQAIGYRPFYAQLIGPAGTPLTGPAGTPSVGQAWSAAALTPFVLRQGHAPHARGEVVVDAGLAAQGHIAVGQRVRMVTAVGTAAQTVVGIAAPAGRNGVAWEGSVFVSDSAASAYVIGAPGWYAVGLLAKPGTHAAALADRVAAAVGAPGVRVLHGRAIGEAEARKAVAQRDLALAISASFGGIATLLAGFVVAGPIGLSVLLRRREIGLVRAIGATPWQARAMIFAETLVVTVLAVLVGGPLGLLAAGPMSELLIRFGILPSWFVLTPSPWAVVASAIVAVLAAQSAAAVSALRAGRVRPVDALREEAVPPGRTPVLRLAAGGLLALCGIAIGLRPLAASGGSGAVASLGVAVLLVGAAALLGPTLARAIGPPAAAAAHRLGSAPALLGCAVSRANPRRVAAVSMPVALIIAAGCALFTIDATVDQDGLRQARSRTTAQYVLTTSNAAGLPRAVAAAAARLPGVTAVAPTVATTLVVPYQGVFGEMTESVPTRGVNPQTLPGTIDLGVRRGSLADLHSKTIAASTAAAARFGWRLGDRVRVTFGDAAPATLRLVALYSRPLGFADLVVPRGLAARHMANDLDQEVFVTARPGVDAQALRDGLSADNPTVVVLDRASYLDRQESLAALDAQARYLLLGSLIAFAAVAAMNTIMMATRRRTAEFGMLRLIGMTRREMIQMVAAEALITWAFAAATGLTAAAIAAAGFAAGQTGSPSPAIPAPWIAGLLTATALLTLSTTVLAAVIALRPEPLPAAGTAQ